MPYTIKQARKSQYYRNVQDADKQKLLKEEQEELKRASISGSAIDATNPLRDERGFLLSFEDPDNPGTSLEREYQYVRLPVVQKSSNLENVVKFMGENGSKKAVFQDAEILELLQFHIGKEEPTVSPGELENLQAELQNKIAVQDELNLGLEEEISNLQNRIAELND